MSELQQDPLRRNGPGADPALRQEPGDLLNTPSARYRFLAAALLVVAGAAADVNAAHPLIAYGCLVAAVAITRSLPTDLPWRLYVAIVCGWIAASISTGTFCD